MKTRKSKNISCGKIKQIALIAGFSIALTSYSEVSLAQRSSFKYQGQDRFYEVYLPQDFEPNMPLLIAIHGFTEDINWFRNYTMIHSAADTSGFVTVYPEAPYPGFNTGTVITDLTPFATTRNDVGFISALIDTMKVHYNIDLSRTYSCGYSGGGTMSLKLMGELSHRLAAVATVAGGINENLIPTFKPLRPFPVQIIHGTNDLYGPWNRRTSYNNHISVEESINLLLEKNLCSAISDTVLLPDLNNNDGCTVEKISYTNCPGHGQILLYKISNGGHTWPGSDPYNTWLTNQDINANVEIINFFKQFENPLVDMAYAKSLDLSAECYQFARDSVLIEAEIVNPENHPTHIFSVITNETSNETDTVYLFDDGLHGDKNPADNILGSYWVPQIAEESYKIDLFVLDSSYGTMQQYHWPERFNVISDVPDITVHVKDATSGEPISDCLVEIDKIPFKTNESGELSTYCTTCCGDNTEKLITANLPGYIGWSKIIDVVSDTLLELNLVRETFIRVLDRGSGNPVQYARISYEGNLVATDEEGLTLIEVIDESIITYIAEHNEYFSREDSILVSPWDTIVIQIDRKLADLEFIVRDESAMPIEDQAVLFAGLVQVNTNAEGLAWFGSKPARRNYQYSIEREGYLTIDSTLYLEIDTSLIITLKLAPDSTTGVSQFQTAGISVYPNPSNSILTIETTISDQCYIEVYSLSGKFLFSHVSRGSSHQIDLSPFQKGFYFIKVRSEGYILTQKIIKL